MFLSFHLRSVFTPRFTMSDFNFPFAIASFLDNVYVSVRMLPVSHSVISRLLAGGSLGFRIVPLLLHGSQTVWHFCGFVVFALVFLCHTNP